MQNTKMKTTTTILSFMLLAATVALASGAETLSLPETLSAPEKAQCLMLDKEVQDRFIAKHKKSGGFIPVHTVQIHNKAVRMLPYEKEADPFITSLTTILHDIGYTVAARNEHMEKGAAIAREMMEKAGIDPEVTKKIVSMIAVHDLVDVMQWPEGRLLRIAHRKDVVENQKDYDALVEPHKSNRNK